MVLFDDGDVRDSFQRADFKLVRTAFSNRTPWNTLMGRTVPRFDREETERDVCELLGTLASKKFGDLQTYFAHASLTHLPFPAPRIRGSRDAQPLRQPRRNRQHARTGHEREPRVHQEGRQPGRRGAAKSKAAPTNRQAKARWRRQRLDSGGQAQSRHQGRAEEPQQNHAQGHPQDASDDARLFLDGVGHSADQGVEPRSRQHAENRRRPTQKRCGKRSEDTRPPFVWAYLGLIKSPQQRATRSARERHKAYRRTGPDWNPFCRTKSATRFDSAGWTTYKADIKRITLNIVPPEKRLLVLEALGQTEAKRKYGRALPTAMERELQVFLEDLLKT